MLNSPNKNNAWLLPVIGAMLLASGLTLILFLSFTLSLPSGESSLSGPYVTDSSDPLVSKVITPQILTQPTKLATDSTYGKDDATVKIFEFSDFACAYCKQMSTLLKKVASQRPEVQIIWKDFPLTSLHPETADAHIAARCAARQGKFWEYHDALFAAQDQLSLETELNIASDLNLDMAEFNGCLDSTLPSEQIAASIREGNALQIDGTPYLFINDQQISGLITEEELGQIINLHAQIK